jgi:hypothetical protein
MLVHGPWTKQRMNAVVSKQLQNNSPALSHHQSCSDTLLLGKLQQHHDLLQPQLRSMQRLTAC